MHPKHRFEKWVPLLSAIDCFCAAFVLCEGNSPTNELRASSRSTCCLLSPSFYLLICNWLQGRIFVTSTV